MQSIYRFRKADVGLFLRVRERGIGDIRPGHLRLFRNNRSFPGIVDWVNTAFPGIFPAADSPEAGAVRYAESAPTRPPRADSAVFVHPVIERAGSDSAADEARRVLEIIRNARAAAPDGRIAVLVRARSHLEALVGEIRRNAPELRFQAVDIEGLDGRQHVQDLLTLFRALHHRADRVHWLALLRAPWCGLLLADLHALAAGRQAADDLATDAGRRPGRPPVGRWPAAPDCMCATCCNWPSPGAAASTRGAGWKASG
jgi:ATP-dependent helicase/nuclease subunit A